MKRNNWISGISILLALALLLSACHAPAETQTLQTEATEPLHQEEGFAFPDFEPVWGTTEFPSNFDQDSDAVIDYAYSDRYFDFPSTIYNPSLATMSLCLELSSWSSYEVKAWAGKTRNARNLLREIGFVDFAQNDFWNSQPTTDSIGVVAAHKKLEDCTLIALPVRGGNYYNEWGDNVDLGLEGSHTGFTEARDNVLEFLEEYIVSCGITGPVKLWVVGYSRGGAVANMIAGHLNRNPLPNGATLVPEDLYCYTFEAPQGAMRMDVGTDSENPNIHNIVNPNDVVPMVAPVHWGFTRYNTTARLLPTVTTVQFEAARNAMLEEYEEILGGIEISNPESAQYRISEYAKTLQVDINPLSFLPSGEPLIDIQVVDDTRQTMNEVLTNFVTALVGSLDGRAEYFSSLQTDLILLVELLKGYETGLDMDAVLATVMDTMTANNYENLKYVLMPTIQVGDTTVEERIEQVVKRLHQVLPQPEGFTDLYGTAGTLLQVVGEMLVNYPEELLDVALAFTNSNVMQAHHQEITLAWVRAGDPHYTDTPYTMAVPETLRTVRVNCPVEVRVYDSKGKLVASAIDGECTTYHPSVGCAINEDGEIVLHLPSDEEYDVQSTATDTGEVNITLSEYNLVHSQVTRVQNYPDIPVEKGDDLTLNAPNLESEEYTDAARQGSTAEYRLLGEGGEEIPCQREDRGEDVATFLVTVSQNSGYGVVTGGGLYLDGAFAQVEAQSVADSTFEGWYADGALVSTEAVYRFPVTADISLTAHFAEAEMYEVRFRTRGTGTVANAAQAYSPGSRVQLSAAAGEGYVFDHWETSSGTIENPSESQAVLVVGQRDATVTAVFRLASCPHCGRTLPVGQSHVAGCGTANHFTCDGNDHSERNCGHYACDGGSHEKAACGTTGHYTCSGDHTKAACGTDGHYNCGGDHGKGACGTDGHYNCSGDHAKGACRTAGHYNCSGTHAAAACRTSGHYACDGNDHTAERDCGHMACASGDHGNAACGTTGHYACSGDHTTVRLCTHRACAEGDHSTAACGNTAHYVCDSGNHGAASCQIAGHHICDSGDHTSTRDCGHTVCASGDHGNAPCGTAGHYVCSGDHTTVLPCSHLACAAGDHSDSGCSITGHYVCDNGNHTLIIDSDWHNCGHYSCDETVKDLPHRVYSGCGWHFQCDDSVKALTHETCPHECGYSICSSEVPVPHDGSCIAWALNTCKNCGVDVGGANKHLAECYGSTGHYTCDESVAGLDHTFMPCGRHHYCDPNAPTDVIHEICSACEYAACDGEDHTTVLPCGHKACADGEHEMLTCSHYACDGKTHEEAGCGTTRHMTCDGLDHGVGACEISGHWNCKGSHGTAACGTTGHFACDESAAHGTKQPCGHPVCNTGEEHSTAAECRTPGHYTCSGDHGWNDCGQHRACDSSQNYLECLEGLKCNLCRGYKCEGGRHGYGVCIENITQQQ